ncbi:tripartite tricarboxylate transporter TctB family protein [Halomonas daqiaonensis]|uniref:Tripartite tricarboxylate transporter TctB family protein n=1 Tax=Halomonas daqiaonensis TaxID=650850 RepID=A0A1H7VAI1_9GAMM|nr:tripartite tricarboxylate transporter TctB family protein [Halomonas daqiaonensis]SEM06024.1 Tripartite tricarboxylate transporter TctB family protein [Halomonas daqiaonensis]
MPRPLIELVCALLVGGLCIAGFVEATNYTGPSGYLPKAVMLLALLLSLIWALQSALSLRRREKGITQEPGNLSRTVLFMGSSLAYVIAIPFIGYFTATVVFIPVVSRALGYRKIHILLGAPVVFVVALYILFSFVLQVQLPDELLLQLVGIR